MPGPRATPAALLALLAVAGAQQQHTCSTEGGHVICRSESSRMEFLNESRTWREAHELCRRRGRFLVPSDGARDTARRILLTKLSLEQRQLLVDSFWVGAKSLRNGYYQWLLPSKEGDQFSHEQTVVPGGVDPSNLCANTTIGIELELDWAPCTTLQRVVCFSDKVSELSTKPAGYRPSLAVHVGNDVFRPGTDGDGVLVQSPSELAELKLLITCGDGDSVVKDHFVIGRTEYLSDWWRNNFTITQQIFPPTITNNLTVGTFWCQRYVEGAVDPIISGRLHVTTSVDLYVFTMPRDRIVAMVESILSNRNNSEQGSVSPQPDQSNLTENANLETQLRLVIGSARGSDSIKLRYMALYDFFDETPDYTNSSEEASAERQNGNIKLLFDANILYGHWLVNYRATHNGTLPQQLQKVLSCSDERTGEFLWRQENGYRTDPRLRLFYQRRSNFDFSQPACVVADGSARVGRRCMPRFDRGAVWGDFCAAGVCSDRLPHCQPPPPVCPSGFQLLMSDTLTEDEIVESACALLVDGVAFDQRSATCRRREATAITWALPQSSRLDNAVLSAIDRPMWLPYQRMWPQGPLWPLARDLLTEGIFSGSDGPVGLEADLKIDLNCTVVTPGRELRSVSCGERHAVVCIAPPVSFSSDDATRNVSTWVPHRRTCPSLGPSTVLMPAFNRCSAILCSDSESAISWSEAASLCTESNSSLGSLISQQHLDMITRLNRSQGASRLLTAANLTRRDDRVVWGDGTPLTYPALSPNLSTAEQHTRGVLDVSLGQYDFVGGDEPAVTCAVCDKSITPAQPEIFLFYGSSSYEYEYDISSPSSVLYANVTSVHSFLSYPEQDIASVLFCFVSTSQNSRLHHSVRDVTAIDTDDPTKSFLKIVPRVDFGYLICGAKVVEPVEIIRSNALVLNKRLDRYRTAVQEYVVGLRGGRWRGSECDPTLCLDQCPCYNQSLEDDAYIQTEGGNLFTMTLRPMRTTPSEHDGNDGNRIEHYFAALDFNPPARRRRRQTVLYGPEDAGQIPDRPDGAQILRNEFGPQVAYLRHARCCPADQTELPVPLSWPMTCSGAATSVELCVDDAGRPALRRCLGSPLTGVQWGSVEFGGTTCSIVSPATASLYRLSQTTVTVNSAVQTATELAHLTAEPAALVAQDVVSVAITLEEVQKVLEGYNPPPPEDVPAIQEHAVTVVSHIMDMDSAAVVAASESFRAGPRIVHALERILVSPSAANATSVTTSNVAVRFGDFPGIVSSSRNISNSSLQAVTRDADFSDVFGVESAILLLDEAPGVNAVFLVYRDGRLLQSSGQRVTSQVVSALLLNQPDETRLRNNVLMVFRSKPGSDAHRPVCAFWDFYASRWSTRGCWLEEVRNDSDVCKCNHLTNFARIFNYETDVYLSEGYHRLLDIITYVGCALSLIGLLLTMLTFILFKKWRKVRGNQIVMHLSVALTGVYLAFLLGLAVTDNHVACICLSALLHYFLLASFGWMAVEAVFQYLRFVRVVGTYISAFMRKASLFAWGGALAPVICLLAVRPHRYDGQPDVCWMDFQSFYYALALPVLAVMAFDTVTFGIIVYSLSCGRQKGLRTNQSERQLALRRLRVAIITFILLGLPWVFGFLSIREARLVFAVLFCICSMLQGFAIFVLMVAGESNVRGLWSSLATGACCSASDPGSANPTATHSLADSSNGHRVANKSNEDTRL